MKTTQQGKVYARVQAVITRADGSVENWGQLTHASGWGAFRYALAHPIIMFNRQRWRLKQWLRQSRTPA